MAEEIYMNPSEDFIDDTNRTKVCKLNSGLKRFTTFLSIMDYNNQSKINASIINVKTINL